MTEVIPLIFFNMQMSTSDCITKFHDDDDDDDDDDDADDDDVDDNNIGD